MTLKLIIAAVFLLALGGGAAYSLTTQDTFMDTNDTSSTTPESNDPFAALIPEGAEFIDPEEARRMVEGDGMAQATSPDAADKEMFAVAAGVRRDILLSGDAEKIIPYMRKIFSEQAQSLTDEQIMEQAELVAKMMWIPTADDIRTDATIEWELVNENTVKIYKPDPSDPSLKATMEFRKIDEVWY